MHSLLSPTVLRPAVLSIACVFAWAFADAIQAQTIKPNSETQKPNVIIIYTDDQGYGDVSHYNPDCKFATPNMDRLAKEGVAFTDAHCSDTVCTPSRYGLLTGRYCWRTKRKTGVMGAEGECLIADGRMTIASMLRDAGYSTAMVGKWHLGMDFPGTDPNTRNWADPVKDMPLDKGFDYFFGIPASLNYGVLAWFEGRFAKVPPTLFTAKKPNRRHPDYRIKPPYQTSPEATRKEVGTRGMEVAPDFVDNECLTRFTDEAMHWMTQHLSDNAGQPFFLYLPFTSPHYPVCPLPQFHGQGEAGGYGEFVIETDYHVGRILDFLETAGVDENTMIIFTSDNGPEKTWKQRIEQFSHHSNGPFREGKRSIYEGGHRVPFMVRWPAGIKEPGRNCSATICQTDVLSTLAELCASKPVPDNAAEDSQSFLRTLVSASSADFEREATVHHAMSGRFAIRHGEWKLVMQHKKLDAELYNLATDPGETNNVLSTHRDTASSLEERLSEIIVSGRTTEGTPQRNDTGYWNDLSWMSPSDFE